MDCRPQTANDTQQAMCQPFRHRFVTSKRPYCGLRQQKPPFTPQVLPVKHLSLNGLSQCSLQCTKAGHRFLAAVGKSNAGADPRKYPCGASEDFSTLTKILCH